MDDRDSRSWLNVYHALFTSLISTIQPTDAEGLSRLVGLEGPLGGITATCFLVYRAADETKPCVHHFLFSTLPMLLPQLNCHLESQRVLMQGHTRGKVDWSSTYKQHYSENLDLASFICLSGKRSFDRPENQLLLFLLHRIRYCLEHVPSRVRHWHAWGNALQSDGQLPLHLGKYLSTLEYVERTFRRHSSLRDVTLPVHIEPYHLITARAAKNPLYADIAELYQLYHNAVEWPDWEQWTGLLRQSLPLPLYAEEIGRLFHVK